MTLEGRNILSVSLIQTDIVWENIEANLCHIENLIEAHRKPSHIYILPETFSTGFTMRTEPFSENECGQSVQWMKKQAAKLGAMMIGGIIYGSDGRFFNRLYWITPSGIEGHYDKRHLFRMGREQEHYSPGKERKIISYRGFNILPQICYDIRFPVFSRNRNDYDVIIYIANWPSARQPVWNLLLKARAVENQCYVLGVNRTGRDGEGIDHEGGTSVINPMGEKLAGLGNQPGILYHEIDLKEIWHFRNKFPVLIDADNFMIDLN
ncbi:MAG: amidohydrolase [Bacteroidales bacterium]|nr:amidohydrolase [Bacteroidales bacterium]